MWIPNSQQEIGLMVDAQPKQSFVPLSYSSQMGVPSLGNSFNSHTLGNSSQMPRILYLDKFKGRPSNFPQEQIPQTIPADDLTRFSRVSNLSMAPYGYRSSRSPAPGRISNFSDSFNFHPQTSKYNQTPKYGNSKYINVTNSRQYNILELFNRLNELNAATDDPSFDTDGWKRYYPPNDKFFNYDYGRTIGRQTLLAYPNDIKHCEIYEGEINEMGQKHGFGVLTTARSIKRGDFRNDEFCGWGREARKHRAVTEAKFMSGLANGKGMYRNAKGNIYNGDFLDGKRHGYGELDTNKFHYEGQFYNDYLSGKGKITFFQAGHEYIGEFNKNEIEGYGIFKWKNGDIYEGYMKSGKMDGNGKYKYRNGEIYEGHYKNGLKHGSGRLTYPNGKVYEGNFINGVPEGEGTLTKNGRVSQVEFNNGRVSAIKK